MGSVPVVLFAVPAMMRQDWNAVTAAGWAALLWTIVLPVYLAWTVWAWASARAGVGHTSVFMYLVPVVGGIASWLLLGESFGVLQVVGGLLVVGGLVLARQGAGQQAAPRPDANLATAPAAV